MKTETSESVKQIQGYTGNESTLESFVKKTCSECAFVMDVIVSGKQCFRCGYGGFKVSEFGVCKLFKLNNPK